jgi:hypothetical protein
LIKQRQGWENENWASYKERYGLDKFDSEMDPEKIEIMDSRVGIATVRVRSSKEKWVFLHSSVDPMKEARAIAATVSAEAGKVIIIFGFGLGYLVEALLERLDESNIFYIIEPDHDLFCAAMGIRDLRHLLSSERIYILVGDSGDKVKPSFSAIYDMAKYNGLVLAGLPGHQTVYADSYNQVMQYVKEVINTKLLYLGTMDKLGPDLTSNSLLNLADYCTRPGINSLFNRLSGMPVIIVSAGPSLNKNIHLLKAAKGKAIIFAVGTALKALHRWGIEPDFIFSIDPQPQNYEWHFKGVAMGEAALVSEIQSNHMIFENHEGPIFVSGSMPILKWFGDSIEHKGTTETGGSVANNAFTAAYKMGANPIILVGQDLAYDRDGHTHASGTSYENNRHSEGENSTDFYVKANDGGQLLTDRAFYQFLTFFQDWIARYSDREYINATEGGAYIKGTKLMTLQEVLDQHCQKAIDAQQIIREAQASFIVTDLVPILEKLELRLKDSNQIIVEANHAIKSLKQLKKACEVRQVKKMQQHLKVISKIYEKFENDPYICEVAEWFVHTDIHGVLARTYVAEYSEKDDFHAAIADYSIYYEKVLEGTKRIESLLANCIKKMREKM